MRNLWLLPLVVVVTATAVASVENFDEFCAKYNKEYSSEEEREYRETIFRENLEDIVNHNKLHTKGLVTWYKKVHEYMDYTREEFIKARTGLPKYDKEAMDNSNYDPLEDFDIDESKIPDSFSWVDRGGVTSVKDQAQCGSCSAFSTIAAVETCFWQQTGELYDDLSEQHLLDCGMDHGWYDGHYVYGASGCNGGWPQAYIDFLQDTPADEGSDGWTQTEAAYPYREAADGVCRAEEDGFYKKAKVYGLVNRWNSDERMMKALVNINPVVTSVDSTYLGSYGGGVFYDTRCCSQDTDPECKNKLNHAVTVVGYGSQDGSDYWLVKNSWGTVFGEDGYIKIRRGIGHCGIGALHITMPLCRPV